MQTATVTNHSAATAHPQATTLTRAAAAQVALGLAAQQRHALRRVNATAAALLQARYAQQQAQQRYVAAQVRHSASAPQGKAARQVRAHAAAAAQVQHHAAQAALRAAQRRHSAALQGAVAVGLPRVQVPALARAQATRGQ